ncbi:MAG: FTR1 family protein [Methanosarcinales archaeon]|nr:FTR1 family protein [Methanosarcinales archaeon]
MNTILPSFIITFREGLEAFLIVGIILAYLTRTQQEQLKKFVYYGTFAAIVASLLVAAAFNMLAIQFAGRNEELFEGMVMLLAAAVLTSMIIWMLKESAHIKGDIQRKASQSATTGLAVLAFISVFREGLETVLFLGAAALGAERSTDVLLGGVAGLAVSLVVTYALFKSTVNLEIRVFFKVTSVFLILFAAGLTAHGVHELQEAAVVPVIVEHVWDTNGILDENSTAGSLARSLLGYNGNPSLLEVLSYAGYYLAAYLFYRYMTRKDTSSG